MLLKKLCNQDGVSGCEYDVRNTIIQEISSYVDELKCDTLGNIIALKRGSCHDKKLMVAAHMDEVGFIVTGHTDKGYLKFECVGGIDTRVIISKRVRTRSGIKGVIGIKAVHLQTPEELESVPKIKNLFIDIGAASKEDALKLAPIGEYMAFDTEFADFGTDKVKAKALDDRVGCYALCELLKDSYPYDVYAVFTVQEEVGLRGAKIAAYNVSPDACLVLEGTTCSDVGSTPKHLQVTECGDGSALSIMDRASVSDREIVNYLYTTAKKNNIPVQFKKTAMGGNDAGSISTSKAGVRTAVASVPCRYLHSPVSVASKTDILSTINIAKIFLNDVGGLL